jgi:hypothetical protein
MPQHGIQRNIEHIKTFYQRTDEHIEQRFIERPGIYLAETEMDRFVDETTETLHQAYQYLWEQAGEVPDGLSVLEMIG